MMTKKQLAQYDKMILALRKAEREFMDQLAYAKDEGSVAVLRSQECESIKEALKAVREAQ